MYTSIICLALSVFFSLTGTTLADPPPTTLETVVRRTPPAAPASIGKREAVPQPSNPDYLPPGFVSMPTPAPSPPPIVGEPYVPVVPAEFAPPPVVPAPRGRRDAAPQPINPDYAPPGFVSMPHPSPSPPPTVGEPYVPVVPAEFAPPAVAVV